MHQHQRVRGVTEDGAPYVLASEEDYALAYTLAKEVLASSLHELSYASRELWQRLQQWGAENAGDTIDFSFTRRDLRDALGLEDHRLRDGLSDLVEMEYLETVSGGNGKQYRYRMLVHNSRGVRLPLLTPAELSQRLASATG